MIRLLFCLALLLPLVGCANRSGPRPVKIAFMPKLIGIPYFNACKRGAEEAAKQLNVELIYNGPSETDVSRQIGMIDNWAASGEIDCLCVACVEPDRIARSLQKARNNKMVVVTYDADTKADARDFFVNMATYESVAHLLIDSMAVQLTPKGTGEVGILTSSVQAPNQSEWAKRMKTYAAQKYPQMKLLAETEHGENRDLGITKARALIGAHPNLKGIIGLTSVAVPAAAEAVRQEKKQRDVDIKVGGVSTPRDMRDYVQDGTVKEFILWNPIDLGYLTVFVADLKRRGAMPDNGTIQAGRLGPIHVKDREVLLGEPRRFDKANVDAFDF